VNIHRSIFFIFKKKEKIMAQTMNCPKCKAIDISVTKSGFNAKGQQRWKCTKCGKSFIIDNSPTVGKTQTDEFGLIKFGNRSISKKRIRKIIKNAIDEVHAETIKEKKVDRLKKEIEKIKRQKLTKKRRR
jgi:transcriptional regulator NrdR family protein